jgi:CubicO group peptidase (beta-lactamase class C family)
MTSVTMAMEGTCAADFDRLRDAFAENFAQGGEVGATVATTVDGRWSSICGRAMPTRHGRVHGRAIRSSTSHRRRRA